MTNLFSSFNPVSWFYLNLSWMAVLPLPVLMPNKMWKISPKCNQLLLLMIKKMMEQLKPLLNKSMASNLLIMLTIMMSIMMMNLTSMFPYTFTPSALPQITFPLAMSMWLSINLKKLKLTKKMMASMMPTSTPDLLIPLMTLIETLSLWIQPITLAVRLTANMTAGHILMVLASSTQSSKNIIITIPVIMALTIMELCVSIIQSYVFAMLLTMFNK